MGLINFILGLGLLFLGTNKIFNYVSFAIPNLFLSIGLIILGAIWILSSISFHKQFSIKSPGISQETSSTKMKGINLFLGLLSVALGIAQFIITEELYISVGIIILGVLFLFIKPKKIRY